MGVGNRGIIPSYLLTRIQYNLSNPLYKYIDLIGGTSTGGIISLGLSFIKPVDILEMYCYRSKEIFSKYSWWRFGLMKYKYDPVNIENILQEIFKDKLMKDCHIPSLVTSYDVNSAKSINIKSWEGEFVNTLIWQAARATSAAPIFFPPHKIMLKDKELICIDGGIYNNNPALSIYHEARKLWPNEELLLISIGTGEYTHSLSYDKIKNWGAIDWLQILFSIIFDGQNDYVNGILNDINNGKLKFFRFQIPLTAHYSMDNVSKKNILLLLTDAKKMIQLYKNELTSIVKILKKRI